MRPPCRLATSSLLFGLISLTSAVGLTAQEAAEPDFLYIAEYEIAAGRVLSEVLDEASEWVRGLRATGGFESVRLYMHEMGPAFSVYMVMEPRSWESLRAGFDEFVGARPDLFTTPWRWAGHSDNILAEIPVDGVGAGRSSEAMEDGDRTSEQMIAGLRYQWNALAVGGIALALDSGQGATEHGRALGELYAPSWGEELTPEGFAGGMVRNMALVGASARLVESSPGRVTVESTRPWAESWDPDYEAWGVSVREYEAWLSGVLQGIGEPFGITVRTDRVGDRLRMTFSS